jgi:four helix bundle protein
MAAADRFEDLLVWQLLFKLSVEIWKITDRPPANRDFKFTNQIRDASDSAQRNVSEGFGRYHPLEFARFLDIVRASANETRALLLKARAVGYVTEAEFNRLHSLTVRGLQALARFQRYLRSPEAKRNAEGRHKRRRRKNGPNVPNVPNDPNDPNDPNE